MSHPYKAQGDYNLIKPDGSVLIFQGGFERDTILKLLNEAHELGASPPIVGDPVAMARMKPTRSIIWLEDLTNPEDYPDYHIPLYLAQAPQSSPAPSVIEAGDAMRAAFSRLNGSGRKENMAAIRAWDAAKASRPSVTAPVIAWHKAGEFPPEQIPEGHILIGYSNRVGKDEDYSLRQLACYPDKGPWTDWYGAVPNPDHWAIIPIPDKDIARWHMPERATPPVTAPVMSREQLGQAAKEWMEKRWAPGVTSATIGLYDMATFAERVLSLSPAPQEVTVDQILEVVGRWIDVDMNEDGDQDSVWKVLPLGWEALKARLSALLTNPK